MTWETCTTCLLLGNALLFGQPTAESAKEREILDLRAKVAALEKRIAALERLLKTANNPTALLDRLAFDGLRVPLKDPALGEIEVHAKLSLRIEPAQAGRVNQAIKKTEAEFRGWITQALARRTAKELTNSQQQDAFLQELRAEFNRRLGTEVNRAPILEVQFDDLFFDRPMKKSDQN